MDRNNKQTVPAYEPVIEVVLPGVTCEAAVVSPARVVAAALSPGPPSLHRTPQPQQVSWASKRQEQKHRAP